MLTIRMSTALDDQASMRAAVFIRAITMHALAPHLMGTVVVGVGGAGIFRTDDVRPRVGVALVADGSTMLEAANVARCDALVVAEIGVGHRVIEAAGDVPVIDLTSTEQHLPCFMDVADAADVAAAMRAIRGNDALAEVLGIATADRGDAEASGGEVADAVMEAVVAAGRRYTETMQRPTG
ncbi:MAG: hypothetical protein WCI83_08350 [Thermoleophilia bacterium]